MKTAYFTEAEERTRLQQAREHIQQEFHRVGQKLHEQYLDLQQAKQYLQDAKAEMDHVEKVSVRQDINQMGRIGEHGGGRHTRLGRLLDSPYFGRVDFQKPDAEAADSVYIGVHSFYDPSEDVHWVHDWRAPVSSVFYDYELGSAAYEAPEGEVTGEVTLKRQYRVENGELKFMLESALNIQDEVLQEELARATGEKMKNIVATLQRDQNAIIRNESAHTLVLQGAAGSGKTSIALHRVAYLLYRHRDEIEASDILILSPNKVFAHYISNVLPELGEEMIKETTMELLADHLLGFKVKFESFSEQVARLLRKEDPPYEARIRYKASSEFLQGLEAYARDLGQKNLDVSEVEVEFPMRSYEVPAAVLEDHLRRQPRMSFAARITDGVNAVATYIQRGAQKELTGKQRSAVRKQIAGMFRCTNLRKLYKDYFVWADYPEMFKMAPKSTLEHADVFPLIYLGMLLEGYKSHAAIRHLVIDEMQDYTPVHYQVLSKLFPCQKTILGDCHQSVNPLSASTAEVIAEVLPDAECMYMHKSYRSTLEISRFSQKIQDNPLLEPLERHGETPRVIQLANLDEEVRAIEEAVREFRASGDRSMGIICKTQEQANALFDALDALTLELHLLDANSTHFEHGVLVVTAQLAKGLEFERVLVPDVSATSYAREIDRHMLYVACTRAMHRLTLTHTGSPSPFLP